MNTNGAVRLTLPALVTSVSEPDAAAVSDMRDAAERQWDAPPRQWAAAQTTRLLLASVLEARLLHVRQHRLGAFSLVKDPESVTLQQLAALSRGHAGTAGQAFELAVADACNAGHPDVVKLLREALEHVVAAPLEEPPRMTVLGLEKVPAVRRAGLAEELLSSLPSGGVLRTGRPGRPLGAERAVQRLTTTSWSSMSPDDDRDVSQLARADALLTSGSHIAAVSLKINPVDLRRHAEGWKDVPIWVTRSFWGPPAVTASTRSAHPMVVVQLAGRGGFYDAFARALKVLDDTLREVDGGHRVYERDPLVLGLIARKTQPIAQVAADLRQVNPVVQSAFGDGIRTASARRGVLTADVPLLKRAWLDDAETGHLVVGQAHLFFRRSDPDVSAT